MLKRLRTSNGFTLVEVLAAIVLISLVVILSTTLISSIMGSDARTGDEISLKQDTNALISDFRGQFYRDDGNSLCFEEGEHRLNIDYAETSILNGNGTLNATNGCVDGVDKELPLTVSLTTKNDSGQKVEMETTLNRKDKHDETVPRTHPIEPPESVDPSLWDVVIILPCNSTGHVKWTGTEVESPCPAENNGEHIINGHLWSTQKIEVKAPEKLKIKVKEDFTTDEHYDLGDGSQILVEGDALLRAAIDLRNENGTQSDANIEIAGMAEVRGQFELESFTHLKIGDAIFFYETLDLSNSAEVVIDGSAYFEAKVTLRNDGGTGTKLRITRNANFREHAEILNDSTLDVGRTVHFGDSTDVKAGTTLKVGKDALFETPGSVTIAGNFCAQGIITPTSISQRGTCN